MGIGAAALAGGVLSAGASLIGSGMQQDSASQANATQQHMFDILQQNLQPYNTNGLQAMGQLNARMPQLTAPFNPTMQQLEDTPGYKFTLDQGLKAVNNSNSVKGWGQSGPGAKGIADYASGLASQTYQQQFQNYWGQNQDIYSMLFGPTQLGANAAAGVGSGAISTGQGIANNLIGAGNAGAAGTIGAANGINGGIMNYAALSSPWWQTPTSGGGSSPYAGPVGSPGWAGPDSYTPTV